MTTPPDSDIFDATIIGAGPAGLFGAFYAGMRQMRTKIIEALPEAGGQLAVLYPEKYIYDVAGYPKVLAKDLVRSLCEQGYKFGPTVVLGERIERLERTGDSLFRLTSRTGEHFTRTVVITSGIGAFEPNRLNKPGVAELEGQGVYYYVKDKLELRNKRILIVGGGDSAVDWVLNLKDWAHSITLIHRRDEFRAHEASVAEMMTAPIDLRLWWELKDVRGNGRVEAATIFNNQSGEEETLEVDAILINIGFKADIGPIAEWGLELNKRRIVVDGFMRTSMPGVFAAGDITEPTDSVQLRLIATGFAQAAIAVNAAKTFIDPEAKMFPGHSSEMRL
jgi:thioredoxin reductase (NADPH)